MFALNNNRNSKFQIVLTTAIAVIAILTLGMAKFSTASADKSYEAVEQIHAARGFGSPSSFVSYDSVENVRVQRTVSAAPSSYDRLEQLRNNRGVSADNSYDQIEALRIQNRLNSSFAKSGYDAIEQLRLERGTSDTYASIEAMRLER